VTAARGRGPRVGPWRSISSWRRLEMERVRRLVAANDGHDKFYGDTREAAGRRWVRRPGRNPSAGILRAERSTGWIADGARYGLLGVYSDVDIERQSYMTTMRRRNQGVLRQLSATTDSAWRACLMTGEKTCGKKRSIPCVRCRPSVWSLFRERVGGK
jgi:hypothetical protein